MAKTHQFCSAYLKSSSLLHASCGSQNLSLVRREHTRPARGKATWPYSLLLPSTPRSTLASIQSLWEIPASREPKLAPSDVYAQAYEEVGRIYPEIWESLGSKDLIHEAANYYFDGTGKRLRPVMASLVAKAVNYHLHRDDRIYRTQYDIAKLTEMTHTLSLVHDDVVDCAELRRKKPAINVVYGNKMAVTAGTYAVGVMMTIAARTRNDDVFSHFSTIVSDIVYGECMQMVSKNDTDDSMTHYLSKTALKTASLYYNSFHAVALLAGADKEVRDAIRDYGYNFGMAFQLVDDLENFLSSTEEMGKDAGSDLKSGIATAPVLLASQKFPELNALIDRHFCEKDDIQKTIDYVHRSHGVQKSKALVRNYCDRARDAMSMLTYSPEQETLLYLVDKLIARIEF